jgi:EAL domain-containing protein (putative c-di-GMP-specific phosphodiesterase class I)
MLRRTTVRSLPAPGASALGRVLAAGAFGIAYQPIFDLATGHRFAEEALLRPLDGFDGPIEMLDAAVSESSIGELGRQIRTIAVRGCPDTPLFLNAHPHELDEPWLVQPDDPIFSHPHEVFLEVTEGSPLRHRKVSRDAVRELARRGINIVVDDFGAGYSNLRYLADLEPKLVKLDREMLVDIEYSWRVIAMIRGLVRTCEDLGARVVAEGVETGVQLDRLRETGVHYVQGFFLGRPSAVAITAEGLFDENPEKSGKRAKI